MWLVHRPLSSMASSFTLFCIYVNSDQFRVSYLAAIMKEVYDLWLTLEITLPFLASSQAEM